MAEKSIEVFQDLHLNSRSTPSVIRGGILARMQAPWCHDPDREDDIRRGAIDNEDVIVLVRTASDDIDESALVLWQEDGGYRVSNIVPRHVGELGITRYNAILQDFVERVARPAAQVEGFEIKLSSASQSLDDWLSAEPAAALRRFSRLANKSTGAAHPKDRERWYAFLIAAYRSPPRLDADPLARWLVEVEDWSSEKGQELAIDYEFALGLLEQYDKSRP